MAKYAPGNQVGGNRIPNARRSAFVASNANPWICIFCNDAGHSISYCQNFKILSPANRLQEAKRLGLCIYCLKVGHQVRQCNSSSCRACGSKHHTLLHLGNSPYFPSQEGAQLQEALPSASPSAMPSTSTALIAQEFSNDIVLLATASVLVKNRYGVFVPCRALLDSGSQLHLITSRFANQHQVKKIKSSASLGQYYDSVPNFRILSQHYRGDCSEHNRATA